MTRESLMSFAQDVRYAARGLARRPALVATTTFSLSLAIAANSIMFGIVDRLLLRPPAGVASPGSVRRINFAEVSKGKITGGGTTTYRVITAMQSVPAFEAVAGVSGNAWTLGAGTDASSVQATVATGNYFRLLGVRPAMGRFFAPGEDSIPRGASVTVLSHDFWKNRMGEAEDVVGRVLQLEGKPFIVIGVAPPDFIGVDDRTDLFVPISAVAPDQIGPEWYSASNSFWVKAIARLKPGVTGEAADAAATAAYRADLRNWPNNTRDSTSVVMLSSIAGARTLNGVNAQAKVSLWLMGVSVIVLLIACANVANILIARTLERRREIAVRLAMGVGSARLVRQLLTEAALLAGAAAIVGLGITAWGSGIVRASLLSSSELQGSAVFDLRILGFTLGVTILCTLAGGLVPALQAARTSVFESLKESGRGFAGGQNKVRFGLLVLQTALSVLLVIGAGLFVKSLRNVAGRDIGVDREHTALVMMNLRRFGFQPAQTAELFRSAAERVSRLPGVTNATLLTGTVPFRSGTARGYSVPGIAKLPNFPGGGPYQAGVMSDYFTTIGARVVRGRVFTRAEAETNSHVTLVNEIVAKAYWPDSDPIGKCIKYGRDTACSTVVGVVQNIVLFSVIRDDRAMLYVPLAHPSMGPASALIFRTTGDPELLVPAVRREVQSLAPNMPFVNISLFSSMVGGQLRTWRLGATMFSIYGGVALLIAAIGLYGVLAYWVSQRTREIGVRMALGAQQRDIVRLVVVQSGAAVLAGLLIGALTALAGSRWVADMLYETSPRDVTAYATAALAVGVIGVLASIVPARRSAAVDPVIALRAD